MKNNVQCPVDFMLMNENKARLTAFFVFLLVILFLFTYWWITMAFLMIDFLLRASNQEKYSLLAIISDVVIKQLKIKDKPTDRAPKRFAAGVGLVFTAGILILTLLKLTTAMLIVTAVLFFFAFLEAFIGFCAGCHVYSILNKISNSFKNKKL